MHFFFLYCEQFLLDQSSGSVHGAVRDPTFLGLDFKNFGFLPRGEVFKVGTVLRCQARTQERQAAERVTDRSRGKRGCNRANSERARLINRTLAEPR